MARANGALAALVAAVLMLPATTALGQDSAPASDLDAARDQLTGAARELSDVEADVERIKHEVAALDERVQLTTTELAQVRDELGRAEEGLAAALAEERRAATELGQVDVELDAHLEDWVDNRERLRDRAVHAFKYGGATPQDMLVRGVTAAGDWHEIAVTLTTVERLVADDRELVEDSVSLTRSTAGLRARSGAVRAEALAAARVATEEQRRVEDLVARHERIALEVERQHAERARVLADLEADAAARAVLVRELERRVAELELAAITVLIPINVDLDVYGPPPGWASRLPAAGQPFAAAIEAIGARNGIDGRLLAAVVWAESNFRADAVSHAGAQGLAQLMPGTARGLGVDPSDPLQNLDGGARYLRIQLDRFGKVDLALAAYNAGPGRVQQAGNAVPDIVETQLYVVRVLERFGTLTG